MTNPLTPQELKALREILASPLGAGLSTVKQLELVDSALHYAEKAWKWDRHREQNRAAARRYEAKKRARKISRETSGAGG